MDATTLAAAAGVILAVLFEYLPGLHDWYNGLKDTVQRLVMLGVIAVVALGAFGLACAGLLATLFPEANLTCDTAGVLTLVKAFIAILTTSQATYVILPKRQEYVHTK